MKSLSVNLSLNIALVRKARVKALLIAQLQHDARQSFQVHEKKNRRSAPKTCELHLNVIFSVQLWQRGRIVTSVQSFHALYPRLRQQSWANQSEMENSLNGLKFQHFYLSIPSFYLEYNNWRKTLEQIMERSSTVWELFACKILGKVNPHSFP